MFDIGFSELFVIAIVALLVLGPERLPKAARFAGLWVRRARAQWYSVKADLENELADDELKRNLQQARDQLQGEMRDLRDGLQQRAQSVQDDFTLPATALPPAQAVNVMPPAPTDECAPGATGSSRVAAGDAGTDGSLAVGSHSAERMASPPLPGEGPPLEGWRSDPTPGDTASAAGAAPAPASPRGTFPAGNHSLPDRIPGETHDDQR